MRTLAIAAASSLLLACVHAHPEPQAAAAVEQAPCDPTAPLFIVNGIPQSSSCASRRTSASARKCERSAAIYIVDGVPISAADSTGKCDH